MFCFIHDPLSFLSRECCFLGYVQKVQNGKQYFSISTLKWFSVLFFFLFLLTKAVTADGIFFNEVRQDKNCCLFDSCYK